MALILPEVAPARKAALAPIVGLGYNSATFKQDATGAWYVTEEAPPQAVG